MMGPQVTNIVLIFVATLVCQGTTALDVVEEKQDEISGPLSQEEEIIVEDKEKFETRKIK